MTPRRTKYGAVVATVADASSSAHVELATLTVPDDSQLERGAKRQAILHVSKETTTALITDTADDAAASTAEGGGAAVVDDSNVTQIQAVIDLEKLGRLAHATEDEFVTGLHREANNHAFNPDDSMEVEGADYEADEGTETAVDDETSLIEASAPSPKRKGDIPLEINCFADAVKDTHHTNTLTRADSLMVDNTCCTTTTEENVLVGHDAFLLEVPQQKGGEEEHHFVLALPEVQQPSSTIIEERRQFPILKRAMTMMSAHLPTDIKDVQLEATTVPVDKVASELHLDLVIKREVPTIGFVILFVGFFALASAGAAFDLQGPGVTASMKTYWRLTSTALLISPMVLFNLHRDGLPKLSKKEWLMLPAAAFCYAQMTTVFVVALSMTSLANTFVFSNMTSLVIIVSKSLMGLPVLMLEASGSMIGIAGGIICSRDSSSGPSDDGGNEHPQAMLGNLIALSASFGTALYLSIARDLRSKCDLYVFMFGIFFIASFFVLAYMVIANEPVTFDRDPYSGLFGWMDPTPNRLPLELFMAVVINVVGTLGYIAVLKYFDPIVVSTIMLMEPVVGVFIGVWVGVDTMPGVVTWVGDAIVTIGSGMVVYAGAKKTELIDATKAVRPRLDGNNNAPGGTVEMLHTPVTMKRPSPTKGKDPQARSHRKERSSTFSH